MDFRAFYDSIEAPSLRAVAAHWNSVRGTMIMPSWSDLRPKAIAGQLSMTWFFKRDYKTGEFTCRFVGENIASFFGTNLRGAPLTIVQPPESFLPVKALFTRVVTQPAAYHCGGRVFKQLDRFTNGERIILPLATDRVVGDEVFGATEYKPHYVVPDVPTRTFTENEAWFPL